jgi:hypothetical protein
LGAQNDISNTRVFYLGVKATGANVPPAIEHSWAPGLLWLYFERDDMAPPAFVAYWRDHAQELTMPKN